MERESKLAMKHQVFKYVVQDSHDLQHMRAWPNLAEFSKKASDNG